MPKGKGKGKSKKKKEVKVDPNALTEVDKTFYELQIADLNRKINRLRTLTQELEEKNEVGKENYEKLDEDRNDIITYLRRTLTAKSAEINELQERVISLNESRAEDVCQYENKIKQMNDKYNQMHDQLESENKLLERKLNTLEEFRVQRENLLQKFDNQEKKFQEQEAEHQKQIYEIEKQFIISKDKLRQDLENKLRELAEDFQKENYLRIAASTHRVVQENISINNEINELLMKQEKMLKENEKLKGRTKYYKQLFELEKSEKMKALNISMLQKKLVTELTQKCQELTDDYNWIKEQETTGKNYVKIIEDQKNTIDTLNYSNKMLKQNLHALYCEKSSLVTEYRHFKDENMRLSSILMDAITSTEQVLAAMDSRDASLKVSKREDFLNKLLNILCNVENTPMRKPSLDSINSAIYKIGDLAFVPRHKSFEEVETKQSKCTQTEAIEETALNSSSEFKCATHFVDVTAEPISKDVRVDEDSPIDRENFHSYEEAELEFRSESVSEINYSID